MTQVFIIQNHDQTYLSKNGDWVDGSDASQLFRSLYKDEAINMKVEYSVRSPNLRLSVLTCQLDVKSQPRLAHSVLGPSIDSTTELMFNDEQECPEFREHAPNDGNSSDIE